LLHGKAVVRVHHEGGGGADAVADGGGAGDVVAEVGLADLDLHGVVALVEIAADAGDELLQGEVEVDAAAVDPRLAGGAAGHAPQGGVLAQALEVPKGDVEGGDGEGGDPAAADVVDVPQHRIVEGLGLGGVAAEQEGGEVVLDQGEDRVAAAAAGVGVAVPSSPSEVRTVAVISSKWVWSPCLASPMGSSRGMRKSRASMASMRGTGWAFRVRVMSAGHDGP
jgi:hypothetical protein